MSGVTELLGGRYRLSEVIGRGGMAEVWHGTDVRLERDVAVKCLRADLATDPTFQSRFRREAQSAAALDAPTVVAVYDTGEDDHGVPWIVMEYVDGRTLRDILTTEGRLLPQRALEVTADVCSALEVAHAAGMVHRDIKPANVMLTSRGEVKVMDFGIARAAGGSESTMTRTESVIGTAAYLSPEQARGEHVDARSDIYSTGCLLYELITGSPPFTGDSPVAVAYQHVREDPTPPSQFDAALSKDIDAVVLRAMAKNPANRYQSADEMREDLLRAVAGRPVLATPLLDLNEEVWEAPVQRHSGAVVYGIAGALALVLAVAAGLFVHAVLGTPTGLVKPPDVIGLSQDSAISQLAGAGFVVKDPLKVQPDDHAVGTVIDQNPDKNFLIKKGSQISLTVSQGPLLSTVPSLAGLTSAQAITVLDEAKLKYRLDPHPGNFPAGLVLGTNPPAGTRLQIAPNPQKTVVAVAVTSGTNLVPDVRSLTQDQAITMLGAAGFGIAVRGVPSSVTPGTVLDQSPLKSYAKLGSDVLIDVAYDPAGQPPSAPAPPSSGSPTPGVTPTP
ncbi:MAG: serine/threonine protein kinase [Frankiales bacterium]|nr:serine/threonine protein kinase [Frankiales bacterium]